MSDRYRFVRMLGSGGMAEVYLAMAQGAEGFEKPVAIKRVLAHLSRDEAIAQMFIAEARLSMHLHHQNIVQVLDVQRGPEGLYLVMELVNGWDLDIVLRSSPQPQTPVPEPLAAFIVGQVAAGLSHAYRKQVNGKPILKAHRDVSPSNVLLTLEGEVKIGDFGIARVETVTRATEPGTFKGKLAYAAPEGLRGEAVTHLSDQFSLGMVLHEMLVGQLPFGQPDNLVKYAEALSKGPRPTLSGISAGLAGILGKMLSVSPAERFARIEEVGEALGSFLSRCGKPASAGELSRFLSTVSLPPPPLELVQQALKAPRPIQLTHMSDRQQVAPTLPAQTGVSGASGGGLSFASQGRTLPAEGAFSTPSRTLPAPISFPGGEWTDENPDWVPAGPVMDEGGRIQGKAAAPAPTPMAQARAPMAGPATAGDVPSWATEASLETLHQAPVRTEPAVENFREEPPPSALNRRQGGVAKWLVLLLILGGGATAGYLYLPDLQNYLARFQGVLQQAKSGALGPKAMPILRIDSDPPGATIQVEGEVIGTTPLVQENIYPARAIRVQLSLRPYRAWTGTFEGGRNATLEAKLKR